jgi:hypothetical protein
LKRIGIFSQQFFFIPKVLDNPYFWFFGYRIPEGLNDTDVFLPVVFEVLKVHGITSLQKIVPYVPSYVHIKKQKIG